VEKIACCQPEAVSLVKATVASGVPVLDQMVPVPRHRSRELGSQIVGNAVSLVGNPGRLGREQGLSGRDRQRQQAVNVQLLRKGAEVDLAVHNSWRIELAVAAGVIERSILQAVPEFGRDVAGVISVQFAGLSDGFRAAGGGVRCPHDGRARLVSVGRQRQSAAGLSGDNRRVLGDRGGVEQAVRERKRLQPPGQQRRNLQYADLLERHEPAAVSVAGRDMPCHVQALFVSFLRPRSGKSWRPELENIRHRIEMSFELRLCSWRRKVCPTIASPRAWTRRGRSSASGANDSP
jgi:hypothetical protein